MLAVSVPPHPAARMADSAPVYLVLGATGGIGRSLVHRLSVRGARLVLGARREEPLRALAADVGAEAFPLDATEYENVEGAVRHAADAYGRLDGAVNLVGSLLLKPAHLTSLDEYETTLRLNLHTAFFTVKAAARAMMKDGGSIVLASSAVAQAGIANHEAIAAAKAGVAGLARSAAATYAGRGVRVNAVAPGLTETPMTERITSNEAGRAQSEAMHALGRLGRPDDVASAVDWLLDAERSGWVTGQVLGVDGGLGSVRARG